MGLAKDLNLNASEYYDTLMMFCKSEAPQYHLSTSCDVKCLLEISRWLSGSRVASGNTYAKGSSSVCLWCRYHPLWCMRYMHIRSRRFRRSHGLAYDSRHRRSSVYLRLSLS